VKIYTDSGCTALTATGTSGQGFGSGIAACYESNTTRTFYATATDAAENTSPCSSDSVSYTHDSTAPAAPSDLSVSPSSPSNSDTTPEISGTTDPGTTVKIYTDSACTQLTGTGTGAQGFGLGIAAAADSNSTRTFYATATDEADNTSSCSSDSVSYTHDSNAPSVALSSSAPDPTNTSPIPATAQFSESVSGFDASDLTAGNATVSNFQSVDGDTYTFDLIPSAAGAVTADVAAGAAQDAAGNPSTAAAQFTRTYQPDARPTPVPPGPTGERAATVKKCQKRKKHNRQRHKKCMKKALRLPV
jgi:hypothetical protein